MPKHRLPPQPPSSRPGGWLCVATAVWLCTATLAAPAAPATPLPTSFFAVAATDLRSAAKVLFQADTPVTLAATYGEHAIRATLCAQSKAAVAIWAGRAPKNVFLGEEKLGAKAWSYDGKQACVRLSLPAGRSEIQVRFDDVQSLRPVDVEIPLALCDGTWKPLRQQAALRGRCAKERLSASCTWDGAGGLYRVRVQMREKPASPLKLTVASQTGASASLEAANLADTHELMLGKGATLSIDGETRGADSPVAQIQLQLICPIASTQRVPKAKLDLAGSVLVEGEAFAAEAGGKIKKSTEHKNTHAGGCIYHWANVGHWVSWAVDVPKDGAYLLTVVAATAEDVAVRGLKIDAAPAPGAGLIAFTRTGPGWGRSDPNEWQAFRPVDAKAKPVALALTKGKHELRLTNVAGQHMNVDYILLTPCEGLSVQ